jgi:hypothetical protein
MKVKFDVSGTDPSKATGTNFEAPRPGVYNVRIDEVTNNPSKAGKPMLTIVSEITSGAFKGSKLWDRIVLTDSSQWKLDQFLQAIGLASKSKRRGVLDTEEVVGSKAVIRVKAGTYNGEYSPEIAGWMPAADSDDLDEEEEDVEEGEDGDYDSDDEDDDLDDGDDSADDDDEEDSAEDSDEEDDYEDMSVVALRAELIEREMNSKGAKPALIKRLRDDDEAQPF